MPNDKPDRRGSAERKVLAMSDRRTVHRVCPFCEATCGLAVEVEGDSIVIGARRQGRSVLARLHLSEGVRAEGAVPRSGSAAPAGAAHRRRLGGDQLGRGLRRSRRAAARHPRAARQRRHRHVHRQSRRARPRRAALSRRAAARARQPQHVQRVGDRYLAEDRPDRPHVRPALSHRRAGARHRPHRTIC